MTKTDIFDTRKLIQLTIKVKSLKKFLKRVHKNCNKGIRLFETVRKSLVKIQKFSKLSKRIKLSLLLLLGN